MSRAHSGTSAPPPSASPRPCTVPGRRKGGDDVTEQRPTNERLVQLLEEVMRELRDLKQGQTRLASEVKKMSPKS